MPVYEFECRRCGTFQEFRAMEARGADAECPGCGRPSARILSTPHLAVMNPGLRRAMSVNERSRHEPRVGTKHACGAGCGCGARSTRSRPETPLPRKRRTPPRPWMLGH